MRSVLTSLLLLPLFSISQSVQSRADSLLSIYHKNDQFTGTVLIAKEGVVLFQKAYGEADRENHKANKISTEYRIGSVTKPFTAVLILLLQEKGFLSINDPLSDYVPGYPEGDRILLADLLRHSSGIKSITSMNAYYQEWIGQEASLEQTISRFRNEPLSFQPGEKFEYSNSNYILLSYVAEKATGRSFERLLNDYIFSPLQMLQSGIDSHNRNPEHKALGYQAAPGNDFAPARFNHMSIMMGAGSMYSTVGDLYKFDRALADSGFLYTASKKLMYEVYLDHYALGWEVDTVAGRLQISHSGSIDGFQANLVRYPGEDVCIIFLSNYFNSKGPAISKALTSIVFNEPYHIPVQRKFVALDTEVLLQYEGRFSMDNGPALQVFVEDGKLKGRLGDQEAFVMLAEGGDRFYIKAIDTDVVFSRNADKEIVDMALKQGRKSMRFVRHGSQ